MNRTGFVLLLCLGMMLGAVACSDDSDDTGGGAVVNNADNNDTNNDQNNDTNNDQNNDVNNDGPVCGDGQCDDGEDIASCAPDCAPEGPFCGDDVCEGGENADNCPQDCDEDTGPECGNGTCEEGETADNCPQDCDEAPNNDTPATCEDLGTTACFSNFDCEDAADRCENVSEDEIELPCCVPGERGASQPGEDCTAAEDCESGVCIEGDTLQACSQECEEGEDDTCPEGMKRCIVIGGIGGWCFPEQ